MTILTDKLKPNKYYIIIIIVFWFVLYGWVPFKAGFYIDDWVIISGLDSRIIGDAFSIEKFNSYLRLYANRPVLGLLFFFLSSINSCNSIFVWHLMSNAISLITSLVIFLFSCELFKYLNFEKYNKAAFILTMFWIAMPWLVPSRVWVSASLNQLSVIFFCLSAYFLFKNINSYKAILIIAPLLYFLSILSYEDFYFQYIILFLIIIINKKDILPKKKLILSFFVFSIFQIISILWNRFSTELIPVAAHKSFNTQTILTFLANSILLPYNLLVSNIESTFVILVLFFILQVVMIIHIIKKKAAKLFLNILVVFLGIECSLLIISLAGYMVWGMGPNARTSITISLWLAFIISYLINYFLNEGISKKLVYFLPLAFIMIFSISSLARIGDWFESWNIQQQVIKNAPIQKISETDEKAIILFQGPFMVNWVPVFYSQWGSRISLSQGFKFVEGLKENDLRLSNKRNYVVASSLKHPISNLDWIFTWDGKLLIKSIDNKSNSSFDALNDLKIEGSELWVWDYYQNRFYKISKPQNLKFENYQSYIYYFTELWKNFKNS